jgi:ABC-type transport system substrate-binding protein
MLTRKRLAALGSAALAALLLLSACGGSTSTTSHPPAPSATTTAAITPSATVPQAASPTVSASATPFCGLDVAHPLDIAPFMVADPVGLRTQTPAGQQAFDEQVKAILLPYTRFTAGLVEVFGGGTDAGAGADFAQDAVLALNLLAAQHFVFSSQQTFFQNFWDGNIGADQIRLLILFYQCGS